MTLNKLALCGIIAGLTASTAVDDLDAAILQDILEAYTEHQPSTCTGDAATSTSYTYAFPGTNLDSNWHEEFVQYEQDLFLASMSHTDANNRSWTIRLGQGGNMYSHFCPDLHGESMPPQAHANAPWIDEVHQSVSVNNNLNGQVGECNGETCPAYFIHGAGTYQKDDPYTSTPFYSQSLAKSCDGATCTFAAWGQQAHLTTVFTSPIITLNRFTNCGDGIIEHTEMIYNFAPAGSSPHLIDQSYFNVPWSGVRASNLPIALEPDPTTGELSYEDPDTVDYCPLCGWGNDQPEGPQGRCARADLQDLGGYTSFVGNGLYVNRPADEQKQYLWCRKPNVNCSGNASTCMATPEECYDAGGEPKAGYTPVILEVPANSTPQCEDRGEFHNGYELKCKMRRTGFGHTTPYLSAATVNDPCAPWAGTDTKMGFYRSDTNEGFEATFIRHWSYSPAAQWMYFRVDAADFNTARDMVHSVFDNTGNNQVLPVQFQATPPATSSNDVPLDYNPGALPSVTFVAGDGVSSLTPGDFRRRLGSSNRDYYVYTNNYYGGQAKLEAGYALSKRAFFFASELSSVKATADSLKSNVVYDLIEETRYNPRAIDLYKSGTSFDAVAATSAQGTSTTCTSPSATLECSGFSTPTPGYSPIFYVTCGSSSYLGPDPHFFTPGNGETFTFPGMSNNNDEKIRSYACEGQDASVRPTWKLIGFFDPSCVMLGPGLAYDDEICVEPSEEPSSQPSSTPSLHPSSEPSSQPSVTSSSQPSAGPSSQPSSKPSLQPSSEPSLSLEPTPSPSEAPSQPVRKYIWCKRPGGCNSSNEATCMAGPGECYTESGYGSVKAGYTPIELKVFANTHTQCRDRGHYGAEHELRCKFHTTGFGRTKPYLRPPAGSTMGFYREDNGKGFEATFIRHWSWRIGGTWVYLRVKAPNYRAARDIVNNSMNNVGNDQPLPVRFEMRSLFE
eukprot:CAMPEP_0201686088 /NCGR_PEP_ID=MMETSP0578-20130828/653_1 /ASSEMBLY_ACC=CAM_ASM_000663 /TAXON_ID=267565 /ORGANISM="Skeletonema grethea, Strain CCMP 1804" /LENGTH=955 /DNA_ID=CAMNT_0048170085 /DNA_START=103 /DNA_END=2970 /DNA_ORIENTATION=+